MSTSATNFVLVAQNHLQTAANEDDFRCIVSRAYYGAYHHSKTFHCELDRPGISSPTGGLHEQLIHQLDHPCIPSSDPKYLRSRRIGVVLKGLKRDRIKADYKLEMSVDESDARQVLANVAILCNI